MNHIDSNELFFFKCGMGYLNKFFDINNITSTHHRNFRSGFGVSPRVCSVVWNAMDTEYHQLSREHLLWALHFLKVYSNETNLSATLRTNEKTFRDKVFKVIDSISDKSEDIVSLKR